MFNPIMGFYVLIAVIIILLTIISLILFCIWILKEYRERKSFNEKDRAFYRDLVRWEKEEAEEVNDND